MSFKALDALLRKQGLTLQVLREGVVAVTALPASRDDGKDKTHDAKSALTTSPPVEILVQRQRLHDWSHAAEPARDGLISRLDTSSRAWLDSVNAVQALETLPGVSAYADMGLGQAATGNPEFVSIRGLDTSYNGYALNGVPAPQSDPNSRVFSLKMFPSAGAQTVAIVKTPGADAEGDASGGLVTIDTPTAFDFAGDMGRVRWQGSLSGLSQQAGLNNHSVVIQGEWAHQAISGKLGIYLSGYYGRVHSVAESGEVASWVPSLQSEAGQTDFSKVSSLSASGYRFDLYRNALTQYGGSASLVYHWPQASVFLNLLAAIYDNAADDSQFVLRHMLVNTGVNAQGQPLDYWGRAVGPGLPGDAAYAPQQVSGNPASPSGSTDYDVSGNYNPTGVFSGYYYQLRDQTQSLFQVQMGGRRASETASIAITASWAYAQQARPDYLETGSYQIPRESGRMIIDWRNAFTPAFVFDSAATAAYVLNPANDRLWKFQGQNIGSSDALTSVKIDGAWRAHVASPLQIRAGLLLSQSDRNQFDHDLFGNGDGNLTLLTTEGYATPFWGAAGPTVDAQQGPWLKRGFLDLPAPLKAFSRNPFLAYARPYFYQDSYAIDPATGLATWANPGAYTANDYNGGSAASRETIDAAYVLSTWTAADVSLTSGVRYEYTGFAAHHWVMDDNANGHFVSTTRQYGEVLPNAALTWQIDPRLTYRMSIRRSFSRPAVSILAGPTTQSNGVITQGNPDLLPAVAVSYDASLSYAGRDGLQFEVAAFRKTLSHFIYTAAVTSDPPAVTYQTSLVNGVSVETPMNGRSAWVQGLELSLRTRFTALPGLLSASGVAVNATLQHSEAVNGRADHYGRRTWLPRAPQAMGNLDLFWAHATLRGDLMVHYTGLQLDNLTSDNLDNYLQPVTTIDASLQARWKSNRMSLVWKNLTRAPSLWKTLGPSKRYLGVQDAGGNGSYVMIGSSLSLSIERRW